MSPSWKSKLLTIPLSACLLAAGAAAQKRTYTAIPADLPFSFSVGQPGSLGHRTFKAGSYQFVLVGPGLVAMRDSHKHVVATLLTRPLQGVAASDASRLIFTGNQKGNLRLASIVVENDAHGGLEVVGEEVAIPQSQPSMPSMGMDMFPHGAEAPPRMSYKRIY